MTQHPCFYRFRCWSGSAEPGFTVNFLGVKTREEYWDGPRPERVRKQVEYPTLNEEYFEWIDLLDAVISAGPEFQMMELGAGYGRWSVNGAAAAIQLGKTYRILAVEPEPQHFKWIKDNIEINGLDARRFELVKAAVTDREGKTFFFTGQAAKWYGQAIPSLKFLPLRRGLLSGEIKLARVDTVSLPSLLVGRGVFDLIDIDIQGIELAILRTARNAIQSQVKKVHIGTHSSEVEQGLRQLFCQLGWKNMYDYSGETDIDTEFGKIKFEDGVQCWVNPVFS